MNVDVISIIGKSRYEHITSLLHTISKFPHMNDIEFEITLKDLSLLDSLELVKVDYTDSVITHITNDANISYRYYPSSGLIERKIVLQREDISDTIFPIVFRYSKEDIARIDDALTLNDPSMYSRKQRTTYKAMQPKLVDWKIEKTIRFHTESSSSSKLTTPLDESNLIDESVYDIIDVEFEYTGEPKNIINAVSDLLSQLFPSLFKYVNITYGNISRIIKGDITQLGQKVAIITQTMMKEMDIRRYTISEKIDGERSMLIVFDDGIYLQTSTSFDKIATIYKEPPSEFNTRRKKSLIIVDCEHLNGIYYIIDILYDNGKVPSEFKDREPLIDTFVVTYEELIHIKRLPSFRMKTWEEAIEYINTNETSTVFKDIPIDGIVLRDGDSLYKLKNKSHLTIDFLIRYSYIDDYCYLFTIGDPKEVITKIPFREPCTKQFFGYCLNEKINTNSAYLLADFPYSASSYRVRLTDYEKYDGKVVEMLLENGSWKPIRIRDDKEYPNGYKVGLSLYGLMYDDHSSGSGNTQVMENKYVILRRLYPTFINMLVKSIIFSNETSIIDCVTHYYGTIDMLYIVSKQSNVVNECLAKLSSSKVFYNKDINGLPFTNFSNLFRDMLSICGSFYKNTLNYIIIDNIYDYAPSYIDLYALCNFLKESVSIDGLIVIYFDLHYDLPEKTTAKELANRIIGNHSCARKDAFLSFKIGSTMCYAKVPSGIIYNVPSKEINDNVPKIRSELSDNIIRYDNYLSVLRSYFDVSNTILTEDYVVLSLVAKDI